MRPRGACLHPDHGHRPATHTMRGTFGNLHVGMTVQMCDECYAKANGLPWPPPALPDPGVIDLSPGGVDEYVVQRRGLDCDLCAEPFEQMGGPHDAGDDGQLCTRCYKIDLDL